MTVGILNTITTLRDLQERCQLRQTESDRFFPEWQESLLPLDSPTVSKVEQIKQRYDYHRMDGLLLEGTINVMVISPLLEAAGFLDPPFRVRSPYGVELELTNPDETVRGFIDTLVIQDRLWILAVESKRTSIPIPAALPQLLSYMLTKSAQQNPMFGLATNGDEFVFLKLVVDGTRVYDTSRTFSLFPRRHELGEVVQILNALGQAILR